MEHIIHFLFANGSRAGSYRYASAMAIPAVGSQVSFGLVSNAIVTGVSIVYGEHDVSVLVRLDRAL